MAKRIEIAFESVINRKSIDSLMATDLGCYIGLIRAAILKDFDPVSEPVSITLFYARCTPMQWARCQKRVMKAFQDTLELLKQSYQVALARQQRFAIRGTQNAAAYAALRRRAKDEIKKLLAEQDTFLSDTPNPSSNFVPQKNLKTFRPQDTDQQDRKRATSVIAAFKHKPTPKLFDKSKL